MNSTSRKSPEILQEVRTVNHLWISVMAACLFACILLPAPTVVADENDDKDKPVATEKPDKKVSDKRILFLNQKASPDTNIRIEAIVEEEQDDDDKKSGQKRATRNRTVTHSNGRLVVIDGDGKKIEIKVDGNGLDWLGLFNNARGGSDPWAVKFPHGMDTVITDVTPSRFMIGVHCEPVTELLSTHLGLEDNVGLAVQQVVDDSPSAKAGLEKHDIITKLGESSVGSISELIAAVEKVETKETEIHYIRRGESKTATITPSEREEIEKQVIEIFSDSNGGVDLQTLKKGIVNIAPGLRLRAGSQMSRALEHADKASQLAGIAKRYALERTKAGQDLKQKNKSLEDKVEKLSQLVEQMQKDLQRLVEQNQARDDDK